jgi:hypothetical protein
MPIAADGPEYEPYFEGLVGHTSAAPTVSPNALPA